MNRYALATIGLASILMLGCAGSKAASAGEAWMEYLELARRLESDGPPFAAGSAEEEAAIGRVKDLLGSFTAPGFAQSIRQVYAEDVFFNDTLKTAHGIDELEAYLSRTADAVEEVTVDFLDVVSDNGNYYFRWKMTIRARRMAGGRPTVSAGMSHLRFDRQGKVVLHQDFWDSAGGLFEHLPVVGWTVRRIKGRL